MNRSPDMASARPSPWSPRALSAEDRRHLTRFLARYCAAPCLLDACIEGEGPLPGVMDRLVCRVVDIHRRLSGGTYVDAGAALDIHPQSLRVLARKVQDRSSEGTNFLVGDLPTNHDRWQVILAGVLEGQGSTHLEELLEALMPWEGPVDAEVLEGVLSRWVGQGWLNMAGDGTFTQARALPNTEALRRMRSSLITDLSVDLASAYLAQPFEKQGSPLMVRDVYTRGVFDKASFPQIMHDMEKQLRTAVHKAYTRHASRGGSERVPVCISLGIGRPVSTGLSMARPAEREMVLNSVARHLARQGGLREAMPILYQEVARELRRRSKHRAYDPELLQAVGRARQNVHEWEAGRGFHFRGPAPLTVVEEPDEGVSEAQIRDFIRHFLLERSHRAVTLEEILAGLQKSENVRVESQIVQRLLEEDASNGQANPVRQGGVIVWQAAKAFHRKSAVQDMAQRRAKIENCLKRLPMETVGAAQGLADYQNSMMIVAVPRDDVPFFVRDVAEPVMEYHAHLIKQFEALEPDDEEGLDATTELFVSPVGPLREQDLERL